MRYREKPERVRRLAQSLVVTYGGNASAIALAIVATLIESGLGDYAELWQQVASSVTTLLGPGAG